MITPTAKSDYMSGFNAIEPLDDFLYADVDRIALLSGSSTAHIKRISGYEIGMANRMENILSAAMGLEIKAGQGRLTLAELPLLFVKGEYQDGPFNNFTRWLLNDTTQRMHYGINMFWYHQWKQWNEHDRHEWVQSSNGQIFRYLFDERALFTVCTAENATVNFREIVRKPKWLLVNIPFSHLGSEDITAIIGSLIIAKLFLACMQENHEATPYRVFVDEARLLNAAPLDKILEVGMAFGMPLTLIVQSLNQFVRSPQGQFNYNLYDAVLTNCRYWTVFNSYIKDATVLAEQMYGLTGMVPRGIWEPDGYLPPQVEQNQNVRFLATLAKRECVLYDKIGAEIPDPDPWYTPDVNIPELSEAEINRFIAEHQRRTGRSRTAIESEIYGRYERIMAQIDEKPKPRNPGKESGTNVLAK